MWGVAGCVLVQSFIPVEDHMFGGSTMLTMKNMSTISRLLPTRFQVKEWRLVYSSYECNVLYIYTWVNMVTL